MSLSPLGSFWEDKTDRSRFSSCHSLGGIKSKCELQCLLKMDQSRALASPQKTSVQIRKDGSPAYRWATALIGGTEPENGAQALLCVSSFWKLNRKWSPVGFSTYIRGFLWWKKCFFFILRFFSIIIVLVTRNKYFYKSMYTFIQTTLNEEFSLNISNSINPFFLKVF